MWKNSQQKLPDENCSFSPKSSILAEWSGQSGDMRLRIPSIRVPEKNSAIKIKCRNTVITLALGEMGNLLPLVLKIILSLTLEMGIDTIFHWSCLYKKWSRQENMHINNSRNDRVNSIYCWYQLVLLHSIVFSSDSVFNAYTAKICWLHRPVGIHTGENWCSSSWHTRWVILWWRVPPGNALGSMAVDNCLSLSIISLMSHFISSLRISFGVFPLLVCLFHENVPSIVLTYICKWSASAI